MEELITVAVILAIGVATIPISLYASVGKITASPAINERNDLAPEIAAALPPDLAAFLDTIGFKFTGAYSFHASRIGIWQQQGAAAPRRLFSFSLTGATRVTEFITEFSDDDSLTTTMTRAAFVFPRRYGSFIQSFPRASIQELFDLHGRGEEHLTSDLSIKVKECALSFVEGFPAGILRQMACVKAIPCWPIRGIYWFLVKRFLMQNRPIWSQNLKSLYVKMQ
jgi:hypothetical protein